MTDAELQRWWPDLAVVAADLRRIGQPGIADSLLQAVGAGATESEILGGVGRVLREHEAFRLALGNEAAGAWGAVMGLVERAFPGAAGGKRVLWLTAKDGDSSTPH